MFDFNIEVYDCFPDVKTLWDIVPTVDNLPSRMSSNRLYGANNVRIMDCNYVPNNAYVIEEFTDSTLQDIVNRCESMGNNKSIYSISSNLLLQTDKLNEDILKLFLAYRLNTDKHSKKLDNINSKLDSLVVKIVPKGYDYFEQITISARTPIKVFASSTFELLIDSTSTPDTICNDIIRCVRRAAPLSGECKIVVKFKNINTSLMFGVNADSDYSSSSVQAVRLAVLYFLSFNFEKLKLHDLISKPLFTGDNVQEKVDLSYLNILV